MPEDLLGAGIPKPRLGLVEVLVGFRRCRLAEWLEHGPGQRVGAICSYRKLLLLLNQGLGSAAAPNPRVMRGSWPLHHDVAYLVTGISDDLYIDAESLFVTAVEVVRGRSGWAIPCSWLCSKLDERPCNVVIS